MSCKNSVTNISETIKDLFSLSRKKLPSIPPFLLMLGADLRPGLSPSLITSRIIKRVSEFGGVSDALPNGGANMMNGLIRVAIEEIVNAIILEAKVDVILKPGSMGVTAVGGNAGGPVVCQGFNSTPGWAKGTLR